MQRGREVKNFVSRFIYFLSCTPLFKLIAINKVGCRLLKYNKVDLFICTTCVIVFLCGILVKWISRSSDPRSPGVIELQKFVLSFLTWLWMSLSSFCVSNSGFLGRPNSSWDQFLRFLNFWPRFWYVIKRMWRSPLDSRTLLDSKLRG